MSQFIIATDSHVIRKSDVVIVSPLTHNTMSGAYRFSVIVSSGNRVEICCTPGKSEAESHIERDAFLRSLTN